MSSLTEKWAVEIGDALDGESGAPEWVGQLRRAGAEAFSKSGLPHRKVEDWKYTSLKLLEARSHGLTRTGADQSPPENFAWPAADCDDQDAILRFANGQLQPNFRVNPDIQVLSMEEAVAESENEPWLREILESLPIEGAALAFSALNTSVLGQGVVIRVPENTDGGSLLLQWAFDNTPPAMMFNSRVVVVLEAGASLNLVDQFDGKDELPHALNLVTQVRVGNGASLNHVRVQNQAVETALITRTQCDVQAGGLYQTSSFDWGAGWVRHDTLVRLLDDDANCSVNGAFILSGEQHLDHHVFVDHVAGGSHSSQFFRGVLDGSSQGVFNGKARICKGADGSSIRQSNANLLLSGLAEIDTKPELEIYADEVEASHGATVGQLDEDAVFYLRSRGLDEASARTLLTSAFCKAVVDRSPQISDSLSEEIIVQIEHILSNDE